MLCLKMKGLSVMSRCMVRYRSTVVNIAVSEDIVERDDCVKPYSDIPGPKQLPIIGNSWRFAPFIGKV